MFSCSQSCCMRYSLSSFLCMMFSRFIHVACVESSWIIFCYMDSLPPLPIGECLRLFLFGAIMSDGATNIDRHVFVWTCVFIARVGVWLQNVCVMHYDSIILKKKQLYPLELSIGRAVPAVLVEGWERRMWVEANLGYIVISRLSWPYLKNKTKIPQKFS